MLHRLQYSAPATSGTTRHQYASVQSVGEGQALDALVGLFFASRLHRAALSSGSWLHQVLWLLSCPPLLFPLACSLQAALTSKPRRKCSTQALQLTRLHPWADQDLSCCRYGEAGLKGMGGGGRGGPGVEFNNPFDIFESFFGGMGGWHGGHGGPAPAARLQRGGQAL